MTVENGVALKDDLPPVGNALHARDGLARLDDLGIEDDIQHTSVDEVHRRAADHLLTRNARDFAMPLVQMDDGSIHVGNADAFLESVKELIEVFLQHALFVPHGKTFP